MISPIKIVKAISTINTGLLQKVRCKFFGKEQDLNVLNRYGISSYPPANSFGVSIEANNYGDQVFVVVDRPDLRDKNLLESETKFGNPVEGTYIYFKADGSIEIKPKAGQVVNVTGNVVVSGTVTASNFITGSVADYNAHTHSGVETGPGNTGGPN